MTMKMTIIVKFKQLVKNQLWIMKVLIENQDQSKKDCANYHKKFIELFNPFKGLHIKKLQHNWSIN